MKKAREYGVRVWLERYSGNIFTPNAVQSLNRNSDALLKFQKVFTKKITTSELMA